MSVQALVFTKSSTGKVVMQIQGAEDLNIANTGKVSGSAAFDMSNENEKSVLNFSQYDEDGAFELVGKDVSTMFNFNGCNINADFSGAKGSQNITANCSNSTINAGDGSNTVKTTKNSSNNTIISGLDSSKFSDSGTNNTIKTAGGANHYQTTGSSTGVNIFDGAGASKFDIQGQYGYFDGGDGDDTFNLKGEMLVDKDYAYRNVITGGKGDDIFTGKGSHNLIFGNEGRDNYSVGGDWNLANLGFYEGADVKVPSGTRFGMPFTQSTYTSPNGVTYDWYAALNGEYYASNSNYFDLFFTGRGDAEESNSLVEKMLKMYEISKK